MQFLIAFFGSTCKFINPPLKSINLLLGLNWKENILYKRKFCGALLSTMLLIKVCESKAMKLGEVEKLKSLLLCRRGWLSSHFRCGVYWKMLNGIQAMIIEKGWLFQVSQIVFQIPKQLGNAFQCIKSRFRVPLFFRKQSLWAMEWKVAWWS